jgi:predicted transposase YdaD
MLHTHDLRETRFYQEAKEEGIKEGIEKERARQLQPKLRLAAKLAASQMSANEIAVMLELDIDLVRKHMAESEP